MRLKDEKIIVWGTGKYAHYLMDEIQTFHLSENIIGFVDSNQQKWGQKFYGKIVESPNTIQNKEFTKVVIAIADEASVYHQLVDEFGIRKEKIDNMFFYQRKRFINYYDGLPNITSEQKIVLEKVKERPLSVFTFDERNECLSNENITASYDESCGLFYCVYEGKRMYMSKKYNSAQKCINYLITLMREQNEHSPHRYLTNDFDVHDGDVVMDAGVAEGNFALAIIERVSYLYIVEADEEWIEPLRHTFAPYADKVKIIKCFLSDIDLDNERTIDGIVGEGRLDFIKIDIEGAEVPALIGGRHTLCYNDVRIAICAYHREGDYDNICRILYEYGYITKHRPGYMVFLLAKSLQQCRVPKCVRGVVCAEKDTRPRIIIYGAGEFLQPVYDEIDQNLCHIIAIADEDSKKIGQYFCGHRITSLSDAFKMCPDYVVISSISFADEMRNVCLQKGLANDHIICYWNTNKKYSFARRASALEYENKRLKCCLENAPYELGKLDIPVVRPAAELLRIIIDEHKSLIRFGDGEFECIMMRRRPWFQRVNSDLAGKLNEALHTSNNRIVVAIADDFGSLNQYTDDAADAIRTYVTGGTRQKVYAVLEKGRVYYNAYVTRPYMIYRDKSYSQCIFKLFKELFYNRDILVVEGWNSRFGQGNDLLMGAASVRRVRCPAKDAFDSYDAILEAVLRNVVQDKDTLILVSLGPTATVLSYDLSMRGFQAIDIGQLDNEYDWYNMGAHVRQAIAGKCVAERKGAYIASPPSEAYMTEVIAEIDV